MADQRLIGGIRGEKARMLLVGTAAVIAFAVNGVGLLLGITIVLPHLMYLPIVMAAYWFPRRGVLFSLAVGIGYLALIVPFVATDPGLFVSSLARAGVFFAIGAVVSFLTLRLREQEQRYRGVFDNSEAGTFLVALGGGEPRIEEVNYRGAALLGAQETDLVGQPVTRFLEDPGAWGQLTDTIRTEGAVYGREVALVRTDGGIAQALISGGRLSNDRAILTVVDITDRKSAENALREANTKLNTMGRLTRNDLLNAVSTLFSRLDEGKRQFSDQGILRYLGSLEQAIRIVRRRAEITRDYQDLGLRPPDWQYVQGTILDAASRLDVPGVILHAWVERLEIYADPMLNVVFSNLLENAARHGQTVSRIVVTYQLVDDGLKIYVEDDGVGIPESQKEKIFEYGVGSEGGLGLFLVREILGITGMTIREIGTPGEGATFVVHVPAGGYRII
jgi:PAS domain S-box-containing protein